MAATSEDGWVNILPAAPEDQVASHSPPTNQAHFQSSTLQPPQAEALLTSALPPSFEVDGVSHTCSAAPKLGPSSWSLLPGVKVTAQCQAHGHTGSKGTLGGIALSYTLKNSSSKPIVLGRCELLCLPRASLPPTGLRLLHYPLQMAQAPMQMVELAAETLSCNTFAMLHSPLPSAVGGMVGFLTWKRCATVVEVQPSKVVAHCDAAGYSLPAGDTISLETVWLSDWTAPQVVWEAWPSLAGKAMDARLPQQPVAELRLGELSSGSRTPVGWLCWSWQDVTDPTMNGGACAEEIYLQSAKALSEQGFCERGMDFIWLSQTCKR